ncbi:MAG: winged helix-turn-helix domain-containing protein [Simkaniaceae bacterium]|nr:winged helix-turn-helix domain-containing protein [Simkaniaceae bacterium]MCF7852881.1 winged helix-turn-helix domain-containing protein [Simkaniaceae bacterium]
MLESLFGNAIIEKILFYILKNQKTYGSELSHVLQVPLFSCQRGLERLEKGGILVSQLEGKTRLYQFNPRYSLLIELKNFLEKAYSFIPSEIKNKFYERMNRQRPRRKGKPL